MKVSIYKQEIEDGLESFIKDNKVTCSFDIDTCERFDVDKDKATEFYSDKASVGDPDLFYFKAIHASTGINLNDHYFLPEELWNAKDTAAHKRINFEHQEENIIGADLQSYAIDHSGKSIDTTLPLHEVPDKFDICTKGVLYRVWSDAARQNFMDKLIAEVQEGKYSVSMEAMFPNWDYVLIDKAGTEEFIQRNRKTSHMTKHIKRFGGNGQFEGKRIGMVLRNIVFAGKGIVKKPANPRSKILEVEENSRNISLKEKIVDSLTENVGELVYSNTEGNKMTEKEFEVEKEKLVEANTKLTENVTSLNVKVSELVVANTDLNKKLDEVKTLKETLEKTKTEELEAVKASLEEVNKVVAGYKAKEVTDNRIKTVKEKLEMEDAEASNFVAEYAEFNDAQFDKVIAMTVGAIKKPAKVSDKPAPIGEMPKKVSVTEVVNKAKASLDTAVIEPALNVTVPTEPVVVPGDKAKQDIMKFLKPVKNK